MVVKYKLLKRTRIFSGEPRKITHLIASVSGNIMFQLDEFVKGFLLKICSKKELAYSSAKHAS